MEDLQQIANLTTTLIRAIVDNPEEIRVQILPKPGGAIFRLSMAPTDVGKVIGKDGRNAKALRTILEAMAMKMKLKINLEIEG